MTLLADRWSKSDALAEAPDMKSGESVHAGRWSTRSRAPDPGERSTTIFASSMAMARMSAQARSAGLSSCQNFSGPPWSFGRDDGSGSGVEALAYVLVDDGFGSGVEALGSGVEALAYMHVDMASAQASKHWLATKVQWCRAARLVQKWLRVPTGWAIRGLEWWAGVRTLQSGDRPATT